ncbi:MAG: hypothetical protein LE168_03515 [Endomicrobium sp.]|nr:hypothetical protein [Endomicrobium sp.]
MLKNLARWGYKNRYLTSNYYDLVDKYPQTDSQELLKKFTQNSNPTNILMLLTTFKINVKKPKVKL